MAVVVKPKCKISQIFHIGYDASGLRLDGTAAVKRGPALGNLLFTGLNGTAVQNNPFRVSGFGAGNDESNGVILTIQFRVKADVIDGTYDITVGYSPSNTRNESGALIDLHTVGGSVIVGNPYDLQITKTAHASFTLRNLVVGQQDIDLTKDSRTAVQSIVLPCGDINGDLAILWQAVNYNKGAVVIS